MALKSPVALNALKVLISSYLSLNTVINIGWVYVKIMNTSDPVPTAQCGYLVFYLFDNISMSDIIPNKYLAQVSSEMNWWQLTERELKGMYHLGTLLGGTSKNIFKIRTIYWRYFLRHVREVFASNSKKNHHDISLYLQTSSKVFHVLKNCITYWPQHISTPALAKI